jgi:hypothetical protein
VNITSAAGGREHGIGSQRLLPGGRGRGAELEWLARKTRFCGFERLENQVMLDACRG